MEIPAKRDDLKRELDSRGQTESPRGLGLNPEEILVKNAFSEPDTKYVDPEERQRSDIRALMQAIKADLLRIKSAA